MPPSCVRNIKRINLILEYRALTRLADYPEISTMRVGDTYRRVMVLVNANDTTPL